MIIRYYAGQFCYQSQIKLLVAFNTTRFSELVTVPIFDIGILQNRESPYALNSVIAPQCPVFFCARSNMCLVLHVPYI